MVSAPTSLASLGVKDLLQVKLIWKHSRIYLRVILLYFYFDFRGLRDVDRGVLRLLKSNTIRLVLWLLRSLNFQRSVLVQDSYTPSCEVFSMYSDVCPISC